MAGGLNAAGTFFDSLALAFDFTNNRKPGDEMHVGLWFWLGLNSSGVTDLIGCLVNQDRANFDAEAKAALVSSSVATSGTLGSRVSEARVKWSVLNSAIDSWFQPAGRLLVKSNHSPRLSYCVSPSIAPQLNVAKSGASVASVSPGCSSTRI
ncbi:hypothetical protein ES703_71402 [subsurface metagenome]